MLDPTRPLIGITCGTNSLEAGTPDSQDRLNRSYSAALAAAGGIPVILPNYDDRERVEALLSRLDGLLLSGGSDVAPATYGQEALNDSVEVDEPRDGAELPLIRVAVARDMPLLAICRGIQALNVALGGTLIQDIPSQVETVIRHRQVEPRDAPTHPIRAEAGSLFARITGGDELRVNSFHHQAVADVAPDLRVAARAPDGVVEAAERSGARFVVAVQYHPEEMVECAEHARRLFAAFVEAARGGQRAESAPSCRGAIR